MRYYIEDMQKLAQERGGHCLSEKYVNSKTKLKWQCKNGHVFLNAYYNIKNGNWCNQCVQAERNNKKLICMQKLAEQNSGKCLSDKYINANTKLKWECDICGGIWKATPSNVQQGKWCPYCANNAKLNIKDMEKIAKENKGKCLSKKYINNQKKLKWQCSKGHIWEATPQKIREGKWCPYCKNKSEQNFREIIEKIFNSKFPKRYPKWLVNENGNRLELDGYNEKLGVAFEYQGEQHFKIIGNNFFGGKKELVKRQKNDRIKKELCKEKNIILLCPTYKLSKDEYEGFINTNLENKEVFVNGIN